MKKNRCIGWIGLVATIALLSAPVGRSQTPGNRAPAAHAGPDQRAVAVGTPVRLDGSGSVDADGDALRYAWSVESAPNGSTAMPLDMFAVNPIFTVDRPGTYVLRLTVSDGIADGVSDTVVVSTVNVAPVASAGRDQTVSEGHEVTLDGRASSDADGDVLTYRWRLLRSPSGSAALLNGGDGDAVVRFVADMPGAYVAELVVSDGTLASEASTVTVSMENSAPVADAGSDRTMTTGGLVLLDGTGSSDVDGDPLTYSWAITSRPARSAATLSGANGPGASFVVDQPGTYVAQLSVADGSASSALDTIVVSTINSRPTANAGVDQLDARVGGIVGLDGGGSEDPDRQLLTHRWSLVSKPADSLATLVAADSASPSFTPDAPGDYIAQLVVADGSLGSAPDTVVIRAHSVAVAGASEIKATGDVGATDVPIASLIGHWQGNTAQGPGMYFHMYVDTGGVIGISTVVTGGSFPCSGNGFIDREYAPPAAVAADNFSVTGIAGTFANATSASGTLSATIFFAPPCPPVTVNTTWTATHVDPGPIPVLSVVATDPNASEVGSDDGTFTITRAGSVGEALNVSFTVGGTATNATDYTFLTGPVTIPAGQASVTLNVDPTTDALIEGSETVVVTLQDAPRYQLGTSTTATVTIADPPVPVVTVVASDATASEAGPSSGTFTFTRAGNTTLLLAVDYVLGGTAGVSDYPQSSRVFIPAGEASVTLTITPSVDTLVESPETVILTLVDGPNYETGTPDNATITIDDLPTVTVTATDPAASEAGPDAGVFTFTRTGATSTALMVSFTTTGTASSVSDYQNTGWASVTFPIGQASVEKQVMPIVTATAEPDETVIVTLSILTGSYNTGTPNSATVTITETAPLAPTVTVVATDTSASEVGPDPGTFTFTRTGPTTGALTVNFTTAGTASAGDYADVGWTSVSIPVGQSAVTKTVTPVADGPDGAAETVVVTLAPGAYTIGAPSTATVTIADASATGQDLTVTGLSLPPGTASPGTAYVVSDTTVNQGGVLASASTTRFYLSLDAVRNSGDKVLTGTRAVPSLGAGVTSTGPTTVTIPTSVAPGTYFQLACADDLKTVTESNEANNCLASAGTVQVVLPDLLETAVSNPPVSVAPGGKFTITDTVLNPSGVGAAASSTRYYLSLDAVKGPGDVLLSGARSVLALASGASSAGSRQVTIPAATALQTYRLLACADDQRKVTETNEGNNCLAAATSVVVGVPDLTTTQVGNPPAAAVPGTKFTLTDTVLNQGTAPTVASSTKYYLSVDGAWSPGDVLLTGSRSVPILAPGATSAGSRSVTVPVGTPAGPYFALACADDTKKVVEGDETNNCLASGSTVVVGP